MRDKFEQIENQKYPLHLDLLALQNSELEKKNKKLNDLIT